MSQSVLEVNNLTKRYGEYLAVDHISFAIGEGEILGLLGPNGAGKSTTIQMLLGLTDPDAGSIQYFGQEFATHRAKILKRINFASAYAELQQRLTAKQNLRIFGMLYEVENLERRIDELLALLEVEEYANELFWHLSSGQKTRVILAKALLNKPRMILMDEPTASLDPDIVHKIIQLIKELQEKEKVSILFTSHNMEEVARLCDRVAFLAKGKIVLTDTPLELTKKIGTTKLLLTFEAKQKVVADFLKQHHYPAEFIRPNLVEVSLAEENIPMVLFELKKLGVWITSLTTEQPSLEDVFLHISEKQRT
ncbi:ABC transporter ATP-binding protein [Patescibacteria group bacterium]|nr:ABC transporter ATP-binding protein [Patescibacteria group bacterium]